ncbi:IclR family transcriptional regulator [Caldibacillus thermolactis]|jgi:DNA-binding IclR family transcriptional regulator|uniref:IclR family transcriptional regulator n=1 Tax=Pallidibacillus thermolactis TaxID=251051 RepID=A0ABT2WII8_9BACI|nr:IclR family transcriptional regulator [Pallidibacillus thermolactis]MCU9594509.1 IclR family transcriptional regulator [Pallidibacillus thermolactis]MCU9600980.1 IclR family transcriptional regulator [Pallidibacillus thermolactis subsp. kokeshiiformis]
MDKSTTIGSLIHGFNIINIIANSDTPLKFTEIQELSGLSKSNLYKYLNTLTQLEVLYRDPRQGDYSLGYKLLQYGNATIKNHDPISKLKPYCKEISDLTNMSTSLSIWLNDSPTITNIWNTNYGLNIGAQIGTKLPIMSAAGKIFAAFANSKEVYEWIKKETENNPDLDLDQLKKELENIREQHVAFAIEPLIKHVSSWSLPILNYKNELIAAVAIIGFTEEVPRAVSSEIVQKVINITKEMSNIFGYKGK